MHHFYIAYIIIVIDIIIIINNIIIIFIIIMQNRFLQNYHTAQYDTTAHSSLFAIDTKCFLYQPLFS